MPKEILEESSTNSGRHYICRRCLKKRGIEQWEFVPMPIICCVCNGKRRAGGYMAHVEPPVFCTNEHNEDLIKAVNRRREKRKPGSRSEYYRQYNRAKKAIAEAKAEVAAYTEPELPKDATAEQQFERILNRLLWELERRTKPEKLVQADLRELVQLTKTCRENLVAIAQADMIQREPTEIKFVADPRLFKPKKVHQVHDPI